MMDSRYKLKTGEEVAYFPPIQNTDSPYASEAAMHADQANQLQGYGYLVDGVGAFTYLGTLAGTAADYEGFGGEINEGYVFRPLILEGNTAQQNADLINAAITSAIPVYGSVVLPAGDFNTRTINWNPRVKLKGQGINATKLTCNFAEAIILYLNNTYESKGSIENLSLRGGVDGNNKIATCGIKVGRTSGFSFKNIDLMYFNGYAIELTGVLVGEFENVFTNTNIGGVKAIKAASSSLGLLQSNLVLFKNCIFNNNSSWAVNWDSFAHLTFSVCDFEYNGVDGNAATGVFKLTNVSPFSEGTGINVIQSWGEFNYGTLLDIQASAGAKSVFRDSMFQFGTTSKGLLMNGGQLLFDNSTIPFPIDIVNGSIESRNATLGTVTLQNASTHKTNDPENLTGTVLNLACLSGYNYNYSVPSSATVYTIINKINNAFASCLINADTEPTITGATKIAGAAFTASNVMEMIVEVKNGLVRYFFLNI